MTNAAPAVSGCPLNSLMQSPLTPEFMAEVIEGRAAVEKIFFEEYIKVADKSSLEQLRELVLENEADCSALETGRYNKAIELAVFHVCKVVV